MEYQDQYILELRRKKAFHNFENVRYESFFNGFVVQAELEDGDIETKLKLELITGTYLMDKEEHYRVLQKESCEWKEMLDEIGKHYSRYDVYGEKTDR